MSQCESHRDATEPACEHPNMASQIGLMIRKTADLEQSFLFGEQNELPAHQFSSRTLNCFKTSYSSEARIQDTRSQAPPIILNCTSMSLRQEHTRARSLRRQHARSQRGPNRTRSESWSDFHQKHHSDAFHYSSERIFRNGPCGAHVCFDLDVVEDNGKSFAGFLSSLIAIGGKSSRSSFDEEESFSVADFNERRKRKGGIFSRSPKPKGNIRIDSIVSE